MKVQGAMHKGVEWVGPDTPVTELAKLMRQHDVGSIPIGENDKLIGLVTDRDIVCKGLAQNGFDQAIGPQLPVINKSNRMVGILSLGDISNAAPTDRLSEWAKSISAHHH
jgi:CBS domain-containing protein